MKKWLCIGAAVWIACAGVMSGCKTMETDAPKAEEQETKVPQIGLSFDSFVIERWIRDRDVFVSTMKALGGEVNVQNANGDVQEQISQIDYFIEKNMDVIVVVAGDCEALTGVMRKAKEAGIKTLTYDRMIKNAGADLHISFDNEMVGRLMAESLVENIPEGGDIFLIQGPVTDDNVALIRKGIDGVLDGSNLRVAYEANCEGWLAENAYTYVKKGLKRTRNVKGIICGNDDLASQVFRGLSEERLAGKVVLTGQDGDLVACQRIMAGTQEMTAFKSMEEEARIAAEYAYRLAMGEGISDVTKTVDDGTYDVPYLELKPVPVTKENMDEVIISGGFHAKEDVYLNVSQEEKRE
ncbi:substrate-binding domain-containing protein [Clostridium sp. AM58-1XD]|uniref:sugar ABC transporter substrate-binding protein n=1 Tax=Clostridium sp. AM58-1XD TaxID=2292307 RepID=UPI000E47D139|nr:LacI family transcriptional regulator [Clostridium sp. AM58-1XD]